QSQNNVAQGEPAINPQGPVFPTGGQAPGGRPPGTMPPPTHKRETSAPLSAIMGEVRAAKRLNPADLQQQPINQKPEVVKVKKPVGFIKDMMGNEYSLIPKGTYYIGIENEQEEVKVEFTLGKYPVTKEQYFEFIKESGIQYSAEELNQINKISPYPNCPAVMVSWTDAKNFCRWLREKTGEYYALPSIKEWEAAARSADGRIYPWGEGEPNPEIACFNDGHMEPQSTCSVDYFDQNLSPYGCVGMIGNVMEWTLDSFEDERNPHILKGGSWMSSIDFCNNVTPCMSFPENKRKEFFGFRLLYLPKELYEKYRNNQNK
ncbi:MAG: formylglycine-generating enzyme family protein, partial [Lentisphaeraceae bacterium]|nr:formylglycine-generating enzyme family protein [Lentisphaeraceae bacterium]